MVDLCGDAVHALHAGGDVVEPCFPLGPLRLVIALDPHLHGGEHPHDLFFADFHGASESVVRRTVDPGSLKQTLVAEKKAGGLRSADALAAAVGDGMGAALEVNVGLHGEDFGRGIHQHGDVPAPGRLGDHTRSQRSVIARSAEDVAHGGSFVESRFQLGLVMYDDQFDAQHANGVIVHVVRIGRKDGFAF